MSTNRKDPYSFPASLTRACALTLALAGCGGEPGNRAPTAAATSLIGDEDTDIVGRLSGGDRDGDALTFNVIRLPDHGTLALDPGGSFTYTPRANYHGRDSFEFSASDGQATSATAMTSIDVTAVNDTPSIEAPTSVALDEDSSATASFTIADSDGEAATFIIRRPPAHGAVSLVGPNTLEYRAQPNFNGQDAFEISASDGQAEAAPILITATVAALDDPPSLPAALMDMTNSAETLATRIRIPLQDVDGDALTVTGTSGTPVVATASIDHQSQELVITPVDYGQAQITVTFRDVQYSVEKTFTFSVEDVTKTRTFKDPLSTARVIEIENTSSAAVDFSLSHNDKRLLTSIFEMLEDVGNQSDDVAGEPFERKLWRYLRDNVYHNSPLSSEAFLHEPLLLINSIGWGFCDDVATVYMHLARAAGKTSRVWYIEGHVVPEVQIEGIWSVYDPDLAVYYTDAEAKVLGVMDLSANPSWVSSPAAPLFPDYQNYAGYSSDVAQMYATTANNSLADDVVPYLMEPQSPQSGLISIPAGAKLSYPGKWSAVPTGTDSISRVEVPAYANMKLELPSGFTGTIRLPLQLVQISGTGQIRLDGTTFTLGSAQLADYLARPTLATVTLEITQSSSRIELYMLINPLRFGRGPSDEIRVTGKDVWALRVVESQPAEANIVTADSVENLRKPVAR